VPTCIEAGQVEKVRLASCRHLAAVKRASAAEQVRFPTEIAAAADALDDASEALEQEALKLLAEKRPIMIAGAAEVLAYVASQRGVDALPDTTEDGRDFPRAVMAVCAAAIRGGLQRPANPPMRPPLSRASCAKRQKPRPPEGERATAYQ